MALVRKDTAEQIRQLIAGKRQGVPVPEGRKKPGDRLTVLVRCTSSTAAGGSGIGAQCYPGVIVDPDANQTTQPTLGTVWLTLLGDGASPLTPRLDGVYECVLAGVVDAPGTGDARARVFAAAGDATKSSNCSRILGMIRSGACFLLTVFNPLGDCDCVPAQSAVISTWNDTAKSLSSSTSMYGCPPGVITTHCATGAPMKWVGSWSGFTGADCTPANRVWTLTWTTGETWSQTSGAVSSSLTYVSGTTWAITIKKVSDGSTLAVYTCTTFGCCTANTFTKTSAAGCDSGPASITISPATECGAGKTYKPLVDICPDSCGVKRPRMQWSPGTGSGIVNVVWTLDECGIDANGNPYADFSTDDPVICTGAAAGACGVNAVKARLTCVCCPSPQFTTPGYYCVNGTCQYLTQQCTADIWAGPFDTAEECSCYVDIGCCNHWPRRICITFSSSTSGESAFASATSEIRGQSFFLYWYGTAYINYGGLIGVPGVLGIRADICIPLDGKTYLAVVVSLTSGCIVETGTATCPSVEMTACTFPLAGCIRLISGIGCGDPSSTSNKVGYVIDVICPPPDGPLPSFNCVGRACVDPGDGTGRFKGPNALANCLAACSGTPIPRWDCTTGRCVTAVGGSPGTYATLEECVAAGCAPPACTSCTTTPYAWEITLAGFTGSCAYLNGTYLTNEYDVGNGPCNWFIKTLGVYMIVQVITATGAPYIYSSLSMVPGGDIQYQGAAVDCCSLTTLTNLLGGDSLCAPGESPPTITVQGIGGGC